MSVHSDVEDYKNKTLDFQTSRKLYIIKFKKSISDFDRSEEDTYDFVLKL